MYASFTQTLVFSLIAKLINSPEIEKDVCQQFYQERGLQLIKRLNLLETDNSSFLSDILAVICQFCRISKTYYKNVHDLDLYAGLKKGISHQEAAIRAKTCNLIGHMCRHSDFFYEYLLRNELIPACITCCSDSDPATRKFACFALGNAAFHNDKLYPALRAAIPAVVGLLRDKDEKTRTNACGALGNFARNSPTLLPDLLQQQAVEALFSVAVRDPSMNAQRVALFSLGNLCGYKECKDLVLASDSMVTAVKKVGKSLETITDKTYFKYAKRFLQRLN